MRKVVRLVARLDDRLIGEGHLIVVVQVRVLLVGCLELTTRNPVHLQKPKSCSLLAQKERRIRKEDTYILDLQQFIELVALFIEAAGSDLTSLINEID